MEPFDTAGVTGLEQALTPRVAVTIDLVDQPLGDLRREALLRGEQARPERVAARGAPRRGEQHLGIGTTRRRAPHCAGRSRADDRESRRERAEAEPSSTTGVGIATQGADQRDHRGVTCGGIAREPAHDDRVDPRRHHALRRRSEPAIEPRLRPRPPQRLGQRHAEAVLIGERIGTAPAQDLGGRVCRRAAERPREQLAVRIDVVPRGRVGSRVVDPQAGEPEVHHLRSTLAVHEHVVGLEVPVHHAVAVGGRERLSDREEQQDGVVSILRAGRRALAEEAAERAAGDELHRDEHAPVPVGDADLVDADDVGMGQACEGPALAEQRRLVGRARPAEDLDRDPAIEAGIVGLVDHTHGAASGLAHDLEPPHLRRRGLEAEDGAPQRRAELLRDDVGLHGAQLLERSNGGLAARSIGRVHVARMFRGHCRATVLRSMDDAELLRDWRAGDAHAGDALVSRYFPAICRFFRSKLGDDVDDLIQRTFLDCLHGQHGLRGEGSFRSFLFTIAYRRLYDQLRERAGPSTTEIGSRSLADLRTTPSRAAARREEQVLVLDALERIELDHRVVLELAYWEEMSGPEIAAVLGIAANTVRSRLSRARAALREQLAALQGGASPISENRLEELTRGVADG